MGTSRSTLGLPGEFEIIAEYFAPLSAGFPGAFGLQDDAAVIAKAKLVALMASRTNTLLSIPMLFAMTAHGHGMLF